MCGVKELCAAFTLYVEQNQTQNQNTEYYFFFLKKYKKHKITHQDWSNRRQVIFCRGNYTVIAQQESKPMFQRKRSQACKCQNLMKMSTCVYFMCASDQNTQSGSCNSANEVAFLEICAVLGRQTQHECWSASCKLWLALTPAFNSNVSVKWSKVAKKKGTLVRKY